MLNRSDFIKRQSIEERSAFPWRSYLLVIMLTSYSIIQNAQIMEHQTTDRRFDLMYFDSLNTMMLTGTMDQRQIISQKMLAREKWWKQGRFVAAGYGYSPGKPRCFQG